MQIHNLDDFLERYVNGYLLSDLLTIKEKVQPTIEHGNAAYLMTAAICSGIELLGTLTTTQETLPACASCGKPEQFRNKFPFEHYCKHYLAKVDKRYAELGPIVRELIRNGIAHSFATKGKIAITRVGSEKEHLVRMSDEGFLVINADVFYDDFKKSYLEYARADIEDGGKHRQLALENYERMRTVKEAEIERTMALVEPKLDWPQINKHVVYYPEVIDLYEDYGGVQFVS
jgi:hypothetical protein